MSETANAIRRAADAHVLPLAEAVMSATGAARDAVDMRALEAACRRGSADAAVEACEAGIQTLYDALAGADLKASKDEEVAGLAEILSEALAAGGSARELCVRETPWPGKVTIGAGSSREVADRIKKQLDALPLAWREATRHVSVHIQKGQIANRPMVQGMFFSGEEKVVIKTSGLFRSPEQLVRHEMAHALDHALGRPSMTPSFADAFSADKKTFGTRPGDVWHEHYALNPREAFAQSAAYLTGEIGHGKEFAVAFPNSIAATEQVLKRRGVLP